MKCSILAAVVLATASIHAFASGDGKAIDKPFTTDSLDTFTKQSTFVHEQMKAGGIYDNISAHDKGRVDARLADMQKVLESHPNQAVNEFPQTDKVALFNAQEEVNGILKHNDNNRLVCESRAPVGSHLPVTTCHTVAELASRSQHDQKLATDKLQQANAAATARKAPGGN